MSQSQKFFRYLWRINGVLILLAAGAITLGVGSLLWEEFGARVKRSREAKVGIAVLGANPQLSLGRAEVVKGTQAMRANLVVRRGSEGFSSGGYAETRNILFIVPGDKTAR